MPLSDNWFKTIEEARDKLVEKITRTVSEKGKWSCSTCPTGAGYGWDPLMHEALVWLQANPPHGIKITNQYRHECYDWLAVTDLNSSRSNPNRTYTVINEADPHNVFTVQANSVESAALAALETLGWLVGKAEQAIQEEDQ